MKKRHSHAFAIWVMTARTSMPGRREVHRFSHSHELLAIAHWHNFTQQPSPSTTDAARYYDEEKDG